MSIKCIVPRIKTPIYSQKAFGSSLSAKCRKNRNCQLAMFTYEYTLCDSYSKCDSQRAAKL